MRLPVQDRRTQSLRPVATPSQGQPGVSGASLVGQALTEAAKLADQGQKIQSHFETIRLQNMLNEYDARVEAEWSGTDDAPGLQQMRGLSAVGDEKGGFRARLKRLEEFRNEQLSQLPAHLQRKYKLMLADRVRRTEGKFRTYALEEARKAGDATTQAAEKQVVQDAAQLTSFEDVENLVRPLDWLEDPETGERSFGSSRSTLVMNGVPDEVIEQHFKDLRADAHLSSISSQITAAREQKDVGLIASAQEHLEKAREFLPVKVYEQVKDRIEKERVIVTAENIFENFLTLATRESPDEDARWVDEGKLAELINSIEDRNVRSLVRKLANENKSLRDAQKKEVTKQYTSLALKVFWDTRSKDAAQRSPAMLWLERNDLDSWRRVKESMENWEHKWAQQGLQRERNIIERQRIEAQDPGNLFMLRLLQEDILRNPQKYAAENYDLNSLMDEWGGRIPIGLHDRMNNFFLQHKARMQNEEYRLAQERFQNALRERSARFDTSQERLEFVGVMYSLYNEAVATGGKLTSDDIDKIIRRADTIVIGRRRIFPDREMTYAEALMGGFQISQHQDPDTGEWVDGPPPSGTSDDANVRAGGVAAPDATQAAPGATQAAPDAPQPPTTTSITRPPDVDPGLWQRAIDLVHPSDRNDLEFILQIVERLRDG